MGSDTIYMTPLLEDTGTIYMTPEPWKSDVIYMTPIDYPGENWELIGIYSFAGTDASLSWSGGSLGTYVGYSGLIYTKALRIKVLPKSGYWWDGFHYRGMMDIKSRSDWTQVNSDWNGSYYGFTSSTDAAAWWKTGVGEIDVGIDGIVAWGAYDSTGGLDNSGGLTFYLFGQFEA